MDSNDGGLSSSQQESAAELARKKVLAVYSSTLESLKKDSARSTGSYSQPTASQPTENYNQPTSAQPAGNQYGNYGQPSSAQLNTQTENYNQQPNHLVYSDHEDFDTTNEDSDAAGNDYEQINYENTYTEPIAQSSYQPQPSYQSHSDHQSVSPYQNQSPYQSQPNYQPSSAYSSQPAQSYQYDNTYNNHNQPSTNPSNNSSFFSNEPSALKDTPVNQNAINANWQQYHSAWQQYYQNYYNDYYSKAAQNYLATEKLKSERIATGQEHRKRNLRRLVPVIAVLAVILGFLFLQYNRLFFAPIMAYVAPNSETVASSIEAVDPTVTQAVSPEPRLIIPKLNVDVPVAFGISNADVMSAMNHGVAQFSIPGADAMPGQVGNLVISGHSAGDIYSSNPYKFIFSGLERLEVGDLLYVNYESVRYTYQMTKSEVVEPTNVAALIYDTTKPMLTLITCTPLGTSRYRLLITAEQISPAYEYTSPDPQDPNIFEPLPADPGTAMPANEPSFFERLFGN